MLEVYIVEGIPSRRDFDRADLWCEYKYPEEMDDLERWGLPQLKIMKALNEANERTNQNPFYSLPSDRVFAAREFLLVGVEALNPNSQVFETGYVSLVDGVATTLTIFRGEELEVNLYRFPASRGENSEPLRMYLGKMPGDKVRIAFKPRHPMVGVELPDWIEIPV